MVVDEAQAGFVGDFSRAFVLFAQLANRLGILVFDVNQYRCKKEHNQVGGGGESTTYERVKISRTGKQAANSKLTWRVCRARQEANTNLNVQRRSRRSDCDSCWFRARFRHRKLFGERNR